MSSDGRHLATFLAGAIVALPTGGGEPRTLVRPGQFAPGTGRLQNPIAWSHEGTHLFFMTAPPVRIYRVPLAGGPFVDVGPRRTDIAQPTLQ
jgi:hypothetical protein